MLKRISALFLFLLGVGLGCSNTQEFVGECTANEDCPGGFIASGDATQCDPCAPGTHAVFGAVCVPCEIGRFASSSGAAACQVCSAGVVQVNVRHNDKLYVCRRGTHVFQACSRANTRTHKESEWKRSVCVDVCACMCVRTRARVCGIV